MTENPRQNVTFPSNGSQAHGYLATPASGSGPGVIVIQEWWGLTDHIADISDRLAAEGFVALAPDLYGGKVAHDADEQGDAAAGGVSHGVEHLVDGQRHVAQGDERDRVVVGRHEAPR